jgi:translation elongation factor P/translation initiation factor 5A
MKVKELKVGDIFTFEGNAYQIIEFQSIGVLVKDTKNRLQVLGKKTEIEYGG